MNRSRRYDAVVVGAGLAGSEAAFAAARAGLDTLLVTTTLDTVYNLFEAGVRLRPPAGTLMAELVAAEADDDGFVSAWKLHRAAKQRLEALPSLHLLQSNVDALIERHGRIEGVTTWEGVERRGGTVALCVGSFLAARLTLGRAVEMAGRLGEMAYDELYQDLVLRGFRLRDLTFAVAAAGGRPGYSISCRVFDAAEISSGLRLSRLAGLYAAGLCLTGPQGYEVTAAQGRSLGALLVSEAGRSS